MKNVPLGLAFCLPLPLTLNKPPLPSPPISFPRLSVTSLPSATHSPNPHVSRRIILKFFALIPFVPAIPGNAALRVADPDAGTSITTAPAGYSYFDFIKPGAESPLVEDDSAISIHYTLGTTGARNGWRIDSSYGRAPLTFTVGRGEVVKGLDLGVVGMRLGGKRRIIIPSEMGYRTKDDRPVVMGFAEYQRFKNIYLNPDRQYKPDLVMDVSVVKVHSRA